MKRLKPKINIEKLSKKVSEAKKGDKKALEYIVAETSGYIYYYCLSILKDDEKARDAVQDIFIKLLNNLASVDNPKLFLGWLKSVTANHCKNILNIKNYDEELTDSFVEKDIQYIPDKYIEKSELCKDIRNAIEELPIHQKECILLYYYQQLSIKEISTVLNIKEGTVKSRLYFARKIMAEKLEKYGKENLLKGFSPLCFISYSLIKEAEKYKFKITSGSVFALKINKPFIDFSTPLTATASMSSGLFVKAAVAFSVIVLGVGGFTAYSTLNSQNNLNSNTVSSLSKNKVNNSIMKYAEKYIKHTYNKFDFLNGKKRKYYVKKKNRQGITATFNNYENFKYSKNPIWVVVIKNTRKNYKEKLIPAKGVTNDEIWNQISETSKKLKLAWRDKKGNVWVFYKKQTVFTFVEIDAVTKENLGLFQFVHTDSGDDILLQNLKADFRYAYKQELNI